MCLRRARWGGRSRRAQTPKPPGSLPYSYDWLQASWDPLRVVRLRLLSLKPPGTCTLLGIARVRRFTSGGGGGKRGPQECVGADDAAGPSGGPESDGGTPIMSHTGGDCGGGRGDPLPHLPEALNPPAVASVASQSEQIRMLLQHALTPLDSMGGAWGLGPEAAAALMHAYHILLSLICCKPPVCISPTAYQYLFLQMPVQDASACRPHWTSCASGSRQPTAGGREGPCRPWPARWRGRHC